jgi:predicted enzyme related to lactoylglutathione lyase
LFARRADERPTETPSLVLIADDVRESFETLREKGIAFAQEPTEAPWNRAETFALFRDSENNTIMISSREGG